jgi:hypothetical protein
MLARSLVVLFALGQSGSALSAADIQRVVQQNARDVKERCWGADAGAADVRITVHMTIASSGKVQSATASGNDPVVSGCVESQIKTWVFPASNGPTSVNLPFHFVRSP